MGKTDTFRTCSSSGWKRGLWTGVWWLIGIVAFVEVLAAAVALSGKVASWQRMEQDRMARMERQKAEQMAARKAVLSPLAPRPVEVLLNTFAPDDPSPSSDKKTGGSGSHDAAPALTPLADLMRFGADDDKGEGIIATGEEELDKLIREARAAQIEGDMRKAILKLEEAKTLHEKHPAVLYYFGLTYEMLLNSAKARDYYLKVFQMRENAGPFYPEAAKKLQMGFSLAEDMRGKMSFGPIQVFHDPDKSKGEIVILTIPVRVAPGVSLRPDDLYIPVQFFDIINDREIAITRSEKPTITWNNPVPDWKSGEEVMQVRYFMPTLSSEEVMALGDVHYYGYTAKLYYKSEPMDCKSAPNSLILVEQKKNAAGEGSDADGSLLPPIETESAADHMMPAYDDDSGSDIALPPISPQ